MREFFFSSSGEFFREGNFFREGDFVFGGGVLCFLPV